MVSRSQHPQPTSPRVIHIWQIDLHQGPYPLYSLLARSEGRPGSLLEYHSAGCLLFLCCESGSEA